MFVHSGSVSVEDTTYLGMVLNLSANPPSRPGHAAAKPSYVRRPSSSASASIVSWVLNSSPSSPRSNSNDQAPRTKSSSPPGASITPSSDTNSVTTSLPIVASRAGYSSAGSPSRSTSPVSGSTRVTAGASATLTSTVPSGAASPARVALASPCKPAFTR